MNRKNLLHLLAIMMVTMLSVGLVACSKDDDEKSGSNSSTPSQFVGYWFGYDTGSEGYWLVLNLSNNGYGSFKLFKSNLSENRVISEYSSLPWKYNSSKKQIFLYTSGNEGYAFPVLSIGSTTMKVSVSLTSKTVEFNMEKSSGSGGSGGSSGSGSSSGTKCKYCLGSGKCSNYVSSTYNKYYCQGSGKCQYCGGDGWADGFGINNVLCVNCYPDDGDGYCSWCKGTGKCSHCNGSGYQ